MANATVKTERWKHGDVYYARRTLIADRISVNLAYVVTDDPAKIGTLGKHGELVVEYISADRAKQWDAAPCPQQ